RYLSATNSDFEVHVFRQCSVPNYQHLRKEKFMCWRVIQTLAILAALAIGAIWGEAQIRDVTIETDGGIGYTQVNRSAWSGLRGLTDWNQTMWAVNGRAFFLPVHGANLGFEYGHQYLWYYEVPYSSYTLYRNV